jgi:hypothetical protein
MAALLHLAIGVKGAQTRSCSLSVLVQQTAEQVAPTHSALLILGVNGQPGGLIWRLEPERPVRAVFVVVPDLDPQDPLAVAAPEDQQPVQALGADGADPSLGVRVCLGARTGVISTHDACDLLAQERRPSTALPPRCRVEPLAAQRGPNRGRRDGHAEPQQLTLDALVAPARVLRGQPDDQLLYLRVQRRPTGLAVWVGPAAGDQAPMPAQQRTRGNEEARPANWQLTGCVRVCVPHSPPTGGWPSRSVNWP